MLFSMSIVFLVLEYIFTENGECHTIRISQKNEKNKSIEVAIVVKLRARPMI